MKRIFAVIAVCCAAGAAWADPVYDTQQFTAYENDGTAALQAGDYASAEEAFASAVLYNPQQAGGFYNLAAAAARHGDTARALAALEHFAAFGFYVDLASAPDFASLRGSARFQAIRRKIAGETAPVCACQRVYEGTANSFIAEGIANDLRTGRLFVASVTQRKIVAIQNGKAHDFAIVPDGLSPLGIRINAAHDLLWVAASTLPQSNGGDGDMGNAALLAFDITSGALRYRYNAPVYEAKRSFSDMTFAQDGTAYVSDAIEGSIFRLKPGGDALEVVGSRARFSSPQGMVVSADGNRLLVADYAAGLQVLDLNSGEVANVAVPPGVTTLGMDGLVQLPNGNFAATQNGIRPNRVVTFRLSRDWMRLESFSVVARASPDVSDISLLTPDGNDVLVVGVSQWSSFGDDPAPAKPLKPWRVVRVTLP
ncbi:MAG: hypothetical protein JSR81_15850 [Proteobacteria bacterium]|nr:hypothetical protein [Pseudomonadota bacterium]